MNDIFRELKKGVDFDFGDNDAYTVVSQMLVKWCEKRGRRFSNLIIKIKVGNDEYTVFESFDSNDYYFVSEWDWYEGENTIQIIDIKRLEDVFNNELCGVSTKIREKPNDEIEQAFRQGYLAGQRKEHTMTNDNIEDLRKILSHYGTGPQKAKLCEELRELIEAASADSHYETIDTRAHFIEELADVSIMVEQMKISLDLDEQAEYYKWVEFKINRQIGRIENERT